MTRRNNKELKDVWKTPDTLLDNIYEPIYTDPASADDTNIGTINYTKDDNGLDKEWHNSVFVNPPFSKKAAFLQKAIEESQTDSVDTVYVVTPDSTDVQSWWHEHIAPHASYVWFSEGRISYINPDTGEQAGSPTFGTAVSMFGKPPQETLRNFQESGHLVKTVTDV